MKTACKRQGKAIMDVYFVISVILKLFFSIKIKQFSLKSAGGCCMSRHLKEHSTVVVNLRKSF